MSIGKKLNDFKTRCFSESITVPQILNTSYLPSLDGLRAISILLVVLTHFKNRYGDFFPSIATQLLLTKTLGVYVFFCLSGFLITTLLLKEQIAKKTISLKKFYIRRVLRIVPVSVLYITLLFILNKVFKMNISYIAFASAFFYTVNIVSNKQWMIGHYWSLSVEEQFYLFFPFLLKRDVNTALRVILLLLSLIILTRYVSYSGVFSKYIVFSVFENLVKSLDGVLIGALTAILLFKNVIPLNFIIKYNWYIKLACIMLIPLFYSDTIGFQAVNSLIASAFICILIICCIIKTNDIVFKLLNTKIMIKIGVLSYIIYIFQQFFLLPPAKFLFDEGLKSVGQNVYHFGLIYFPYNLIFIFLVSYISYTFYEKRFLKLKSKFN
jgi:peptidoglycan/LPS O-acetylase OafA/YrhL